jgi:two-component system, NarL family, nitrate/nitrite response regulator NarL
MTRNASVTRILIADDHTIFRDGLRTLFAGERQFNIAGEASGGDETLRMVELVNPDILLLDLVMPKLSGLEVLKSLADKGATVRSIILSGAADGRDIARAFELGARGLVLKESATTLLFKSIQAVMAGQYWIGQSSVATLSQSLEHYRDSAKERKQKDFGLTVREMEIARAVVSGYSNKEIANRHGISEQTVKHHITNIFDKLGVFNRLELTLFVFHHNLIEK